MYVVWLCVLVFVCVYVGFQEFEATNKWVDFYINCKMDGECVKIQMVDIGLFVLYLEMCESV